MERDRVDEEEEEEERGRRRDELAIVRRELGRARQSQRDLRSNNRALAQRVDVAEAVASRAERDLERVVEAWATTRASACPSPSRRETRGRSKWRTFVVVTLFAYVFVQKLF